MSQPPQCGIWGKPYTHRCPNAAKYRLMHPDGIQFLGDLVCPDHAARFIELYATPYPGRPIEYWDAIEIGPNERGYGEFTTPAADPIDRDRTPYKIPPIPVKTPLSPAQGLKHLPMPRKQRGIAAIDVDGLNEIEEEAARDEAALDFKIYLANDD